MAMSDERLAEIKEELAQVEEEDPSPWREEHTPMPDWGLYRCSDTEPIQNAADEMVINFGCKECNFQGFRSKSTKEFVLHAPELVAELIAAVDENQQLRGHLAQLKELLDKLVNVHHNPTGHACDEAGIVMRQPFERRDLSHAPEGSHHCLYCDWYNDADLDAVPQHDNDCPIRLGQEFLNKAKTETTLTPKMQSGGNDG